MDLCRNRYQGRTKPSELFMGNAHGSWQTEKAGLRYCVEFVRLRIDSVVLPPKDAPASLAALLSKALIGAIRVDGDDDALLLMWATMLAAELTVQIDAVNPAGLDGKAWAAAKAEAAKKLASQFHDLPRQDEEFPDPRTAAYSRRVWLEAIRALAGEEGGKCIKSIRERLAKEGHKLELRAATEALLLARGTGAEELLLAELESGDLQRQKAALNGVRAGCSDAVVVKTAAVLSGCTDEPLIAAAIRAIHR
jgi:hypothetical protein